MVKTIYYSQILAFVDFEVHYMFVTVLSLRNLEAVTEEAMQLRRLIKSSNESLGPYLSSGIFRAPELRYQGGLARPPPIYNVTIPQKAWV